MQYFASFYILFSKYGVVFTRKACPNLKTFQVLSCHMWLLVAITLDNVAVDNYQLHVPLHLSSNMQLQAI